MTKKEIAQVRRRFSSKYSNATKIVGCYVNDKKERISTFSTPVAVMGEEETEKYFSIFKKTLSGIPDKNLIDISFTTSQVAGSSEHELLMKLRESALKDEESLNKLFDIIIESFSYDESYVILLIHDKFDVYKPSYENGEKGESDDVFTFFSCAICPVNETKMALGYLPTENCFHATDPDFIIANPLLGFLFPAFDDFATNIYDALYYTKSVKDSHSEVADAIFNVPCPPPSEEQKETFQNILSESLENECSCQVVNSIHEELCNIIEENKENKEEELPKVTKRQIKSCLSSCGVSDEGIESFDESFDRAFGRDAEISPHNVLNPKQLEIKMDDVTIKVNPKRRDLIDTRVIDGSNYILIRANETVSINGVTIHIEDTEKELAKI